ncbi:MAG: hypothetical protein ACRCZ2_12955 [Fusobacteriaceae bacterium]
MKQDIINKLEELKKNNPTTSLVMTKEKVLDLQNEAIVIGFDPEWLAMVFDLTNTKDWVRMAFKLEHLIRLFKGRLVCVEEFIIDATGKSTSKKT